MKKTSIILLISVFLISLMFLSACGKRADDIANKNENETVAENEVSENSDNLDLPAQIPAISGQIVEVGQFTVFVPEGWFVHPVYINDAIREDRVNIVKGTDDPDKASNAPMLSLSYGWADSPISFVDKETYDDDEAEDIEPAIIGGRTFKGYKVNSSGHDIIYLFTEDGGDQFQIIIYYNQPEGQISLEDADVRAIIESFKQKELSSMPD